jgi:hypothetical protein
MAESNGEEVGQITVDEEEYAAIEMALSQVASLSKAWARLRRAPRAVPCDALGPAAPARVINHGRPRT